MSQKKHVAFVANGCQWSVAFLEELNKTPWIQEFEIICVNPKSGPKPKFPAWLKQTPTLVIAGEKAPRIDGEVMNWLSEKRMMGQAQRTNQVMDPAAVDNEPMAWNRSELGVGLYGGGGVSYSLLNSDTSTEGAGGNTMPGTFSFLNGQAGPGSQASNNFPGGGDSRGGKKTKKEEMFDQQMDEYMKSRDFGMPKGPSRI